MKKKKILIIGLTNRMGGVETFIYNTTTNLNKNNFDFDYLVHGSDNCVYQDEINEYYGNNKHIYFFKSFKKHPISCFINLWKFYKKHKGEYDFVHLQTGVCSEVVYVFPFNYFFKFKVIIHSHCGNGKSKILNNIFKIIVNMISYKRLSCSFEATKWLFGEKNITDVKIINNGVNSRRFIFNESSRNKIRNELGLKENDLLVGHIGRFSPAKNHRKILGIFKSIINQHSNSYLALIGVGEDFESIKNIIFNDPILSKKVFVLGKKMNTEQYYSAFDLFLMPSLYEGLPIVGIEAQCSGLRCYFSNTIDPQILITDKAKMIDLNYDSDKWADLILKDVNKKYDRKKYSEIIEESGYSQNNTLKALESVYK